MSDELDIERIRRCLIECNALEDLTGYHDDIMDAEAGDISDDVVRRCRDIEYAIAWLKAEAPAVPEASPRLVSRAT